jgi:CBS domain containing-hemolysin-like protein
MDDLKTKNVYWKFIKFFISASLSIIVLEAAGVDATQANILSIDTFSFAVLILLSICLYAFDSILNGIANGLNEKKDRLQSLK